MQSFEFYSPTRVVFGPGREAEVGRLAQEQGCEEGFRVAMNCNALGGQTVYHIHMHVLGKRQMTWPPG